jgi:hypothetical protein
MPKLIVNVDKNVLRNARMQAEIEGTSVHEVVQTFITKYSAGNAQTAVGQGFLDLARKSRSNNEGARWTREDAY